MLRILLHKVNTVNCKDMISPFPPEVLLHAGPHGGHEVVEVHDDVHAHVEEPAEDGVAATNKPAKFPVIVIARFTAN